MDIGLWVLAGLIAFMLIEKMFPDDEEDEGEVEEVGRGEGD